MYSIGRLFGGLLAAALMVLGLSACYMSDVQTSEIGIELNRGQVTDLKEPGGHQSLDPFAGLQVIDGSAKSFEWSDPDLVTADKQPLGVTLAVTFARKRDRDSVLLMWNQYRSEAVSDDALIGQVNSRIPSAAKTVTVRYTLDQLLGTGPGEGGGRSVVTTELFALLEPELAEFGVQLLDVRVVNFAPDAKYLELLKEKSNVKIESEINAQRTQQLAEQLKQEQATTQIELEKARRQNQVSEELAKVYDLSPRAYELRRLELLTGLLGPSDKVYFIPEGTDITLYLGGTMQPVPGAPASPQ